MINCEDQSKEMEAQNCCIKWTKQLQHLQSTLTDYMEDQFLCDVTLATTSEAFNAHQLVLSACSPYFKNIFTNLPTHKHPVILLQDVSSLEIKTLLDYMYKGQAIVPTNLLPALLKTCKILQIQGLCNDSDENYSQSTNENVNGENTVTTNKNCGKENYYEINVQSTSKNVVTDHMQSEYKSKNKCKRKLCDRENNLQPLQERNKDTIQDETLNEHPDNLNQEKRQKRDQHCQTPPHISVTPDKLLFPTVARNFTEGTNKATNNDIYSNTTPERRSILISPSCSQDSFVFNYDDRPEPLVVKSTPKKSNTSTQSIIIEDNEPNVIKISDDENEEFSDNEDFTISTNKRDYAPKNRDKSGSMIVQHDVNAQRNCPENHLEPDLSPKRTHNTESSVSSDSEIIVRPTNKRISNSSASHGSDADSDDSKEPYSNDNLVDILSDTENLKAESLKRVLGMKIIIHKLNEENDEQESHNQPGTSKAIASKSTVKEYESMILTNIEESFHKSTEKPDTSTSAFNKNMSSCIQFLQDRNKSPENLDEEKIVHKKHVIIKTSDLKTKFRHCTPQGASSDPHVVNQEDQGTNETLTNIPNKNGQLFCCFCKKWIGKNKFQQHVRNQHPNVDCEMNNRKPKTS